MKRLGGQDALFLALETPNWHQHVAGLTVLEPGERITFDDVVEKISSRIDYCPKFTWKLRGTLLGMDRPVRVDDEDFDASPRPSHRRPVARWPPGARRAGQLASTQLDRNRPLWEMWFIEGWPAARSA